MHRYRLVHTILVIFAALFISNFSHSEALISAKSNFEKVTVAWDYSVSHPSVKNPRVEITIWSYGQDIFNTYPRSVGRVASLPALFGSKTYHLRRSSPPNRIYDSYSVGLTFCYTLNGQYTCEQTWRDLGWQSGPNGMLEVGDAIPKGFGGNTSAQYVSFDALEDVASFSWDFSSYPDVMGFSYPYVSIEQARFSDDQNHSFDFTFIADFWSGSLTGGGNYNLETVSPDNRHVFRLHFCRDPGAMNCEIFEFSTGSIESSDSPTPIALPTIKNIIYIHTDHLGSPVAETAH